MFSFTIMSPSPGKVSILWRISSLWHTVPSERRTQLWESFPKGMMSSFDLSVARPTPHMPLSRKTREDGIFSYLRIGFSSRNRLCFGLWVRWLMRLLFRRRVFLLSRSRNLRRAMWTSRFVTFLVLSYPFCLSLESLEAFRSAKCGLARDSETRNASDIESSIIQGPVHLTVYQILTKTITNQNSFSVWQILQFQPFEKTVAY